MEQNITIIQLFHWYVPNDSTWWKTCAGLSKKLNEFGITHVYLPPAYKSAWGKSEPGYAVYDLYDLGEFDQKGTIPTKYGTKEEYLNCIKSLQKNNLKVIADAVLNHKQGGDETEKFSAIIVNNNDRNLAESNSDTVEAFTKFTFPGRGDTYSNFKWNYLSFSGLDAEKDGEKVIYKIENGFNDSWEEGTDKEHGNFDFLMGNDIEYRNVFVQEEIIKWGKWYVETTGIFGFRLDAVKHINANFIKKWITELEAEYDKSFFCMSEYWKNDNAILEDYLQKTECKTQLLDVPLHFNFFKASQQKNEFNLSKIFDGSLIEKQPTFAITFVDTHDTQPLQALESFIEDWFRPLAYALILLIEQGTPMVFYPCLFGAAYVGDKDGEEHSIKINKVKELPVLITARSEYAYGEQKKYFDHPNVIGWVRCGIAEKQNLGCAVLISNGNDGYKEMNLTAYNANKTYIDLTANCHEEIHTDENGTATFLVKSKSVSVWVIKS